ncbi:MAG: alpha/beta hydrolase [Coriobacteriia bacterium]
MGLIAKRAIVLVVVLVVAVVLGFGVWASTPLGPDSRAREAMRSGDNIVVTRTDAGWEFTSPSAEATAGVIIYPGGRVDPRSYAPLARELAKAGYFAVVLRVPLNLAVTKRNAADAVIAAHPRVPEWAVVGHSLGGAMAAAHVADRPGVYSALVLLAAYPPQGVDLTDSGLQVGSYTGSLDSVIDTTAVAASTEQLPADALLITVEGANHAQWGSYGSQTGDSPATISPEVQTAIAVDAIARALGDLP